MSEKAPPLTDFSNNTQFMRTLSVAWIVLMIGILPVEARKWTSKDGSYSVEGKFFSFDSATRTVEIMTSRKLLKVNLDNLSDADREFVTAGATPSTRAASG